ncbi:hypothetical protein GIB67_004733 [Kingdonia uniflora]|uniref:Protein kinase domain-containing protein n=1 Tax=Kingdonia uniflora TaxID=39325 RepID=A0A7J7P521_9MAGN|nr:hypothetical protein GIB67_004733 [Kingdonia uniflora]
MGLYYEEDDDDDEDEDNEEQGNGGHGFVFVDEDHTCSSLIPLSTWKKKAGIAAKLIVDVLLQRFLPLPRCRIETAQAQVYRGMFPSGETVAIKRAQQGSMQGRGEFKTEIELLSRVHHKNVVGLVGFYFEQGKQMLVYEFMPNGTLREGLSGRSGIYLDWKMKLRIALGFARGLTYLHELANPSIIHRDVKSTNILLDEKLTAKVADFGLSKLTAKRGMYPLKLKLTDNSDVYSFGVVMLELISARQLIEKGKYIVREVRTALYKNSEHYGLKKITDPGIRNSGILIGFERFVELAMQCVEESAAERTSMSDVVKEIDRGTRTDDPTACKMHYLQDINICKDKDGLVLIEIILRHHICKDILYVHTFLAEEKLGCMANKGIMKDEHHLLSNMLELNLIGVPYHISYGDRFSGHVLPFGWQNPGDELNEWDGNNNMSGDESYMH